ncbi:DUF4430 domain-containing protein [Bacillus kwashiorkori]|uniref:DUF4430 domain-containing protein n=1 Tax=Bacillus kwashiorkori TaxID=1522318 RepID=UPI000783377F|nr:DUF4430 domain-containing protein [Bacillus kwashiorkori]
MRFIKKLLFYFLVIFLLVITGCEKDSVLPTDKHDTQLTEHREELGEERKDSDNTTDHPAEKQEEDTSTEDIEKHTDRTNVKEQKQSKENNEETSKKASTTKTEEKQNRTENDTANTSTQEDEQKQPQQTKSEQGPYVFVTIKALDEILIQKTKVEIVKNATIINATIDLLKGKKIAFEVRGSGSQTYVAGIGNYYEFDDGPLSGWLVKKNGVLLDRSSGSVKVSHGDEIEWIYTKDYTKE